MPLLNELGVTIHSIGNGIQTLRQTTFCNKKQTVAKIKSFH